jgi:hypothetical protein
MAHSKGQAKAMGHSHGPFGHGGHKTGSHAHQEPSAHTSDHMQNEHNRKHAGHAHERMTDHGGAFPQGLTEGM